MARLLLGLFLSMNRLTNLIALVDITLVIGAASEGINYDLIRFYSFLARDTGLPGEGQP